MAKILLRLRSRYLQWKKKRWLKRHTCVICHRVAYPGVDVSYYGQQRVWMHKECA